MTGTCLLFRSSLPFLELVGCLSMDVDGVRRDARSQRDLCVQRFVSSFSFDLFLPELTPTLPACHLLQLPLVSFLI